MHTVESALKRFQYFSYWLMGVRVIEIRNVLFKNGFINKCLVVTEDDNYHFLEPYTNHLALTKERSLKSRRIERWFWKPIRVEYEDTYYL